VFLNFSPYRSFRYPLRFTLSFFLAFVFLGHSVPCQQNPTIEVQAKTVSVLTIVRDKHGKVVPKLTKDDFLVDEDGRPQTVNYFATQSDVPLRLGMLVDTSISQRSVLDQERNSSYGFLDHLLRADKDLAFVIKFDREVELLRDFTSDHSKLLAALRVLETPQLTPRNRGGSDERGWGNGASVLLYDAIFLASDELMNKQQGRKALIILSDGVDRGSKETVDEAIESAQRTDTLIYSILFSEQESDSEDGHHHGGPYGAPKKRDSQRDSPDGKSILEEISAKTGGRLFQVSKREPIEKIYAEIEEDLRNQYLLGYTPDKNAQPGYRKIHVTTKEKGLKVQAREGYYGGS
jgi:VWFA-related protein